MNQFLNPIFLTKIAKSYLSDVNRIWTSNEKEIRKYQDKSLRKMIKYAYTVPLYHDKYKKAGIHPSDIKGVEDIEKLPIVTKSDLMERFPNDIIPQKFNTKKGFLMSTSGSTGKPVSVYYDLFSTIKTLEGFVRNLRAYGGNWRKSKIVLIIDLDPGTQEYVVFSQSTMPFLKRFFSMDNIKYLHIDEKPETLMQEINKFKPEYIGTDPGVLKKLAYLKNKGFGNSIKPNIIISSAAMLDNYTRKYVENAFDTRVLDAYGSTEVGPIAFECLNGDYYHVNSDFVYLEFLDNEDKPVGYNKIGRVIATRLYGKGTPIIRYSGLDDLAISLEEKCGCDINTPLIKGIEGRNFDSIVLPDGNMITPLSMTTIIRKVMDDFQTYKIKQFQIIQHKIDEIEVLVVEDEKLKNTSPSIKKLVEEIKKEFIKKLGSDINIYVTEVDEIKTESWTEMVKVVVSKLKK